MEDTQLDRLDLTQLSDDELSNIDPSQLISEVEEESVEPEPQPEEETQEANTDDAGQQAQPDVETQPVDEPEEIETETAAPVEETPAAEEVKPQKQEPESTSDDAIDYKAFYDQITAPFKANGRDLSLTNPEDIISLMQRGAGFAKKMATLKPSMRVLRTLENHGITEQDLGFLIDLHKKNPEAINKLIKESGVDVYSLDTEQADQYKPKVQMATDNEVDLDSVIQDLSVTSPTFNKTLDVVVNQWDDHSKGTVASNPQLLRLLDGHMRQGYFDKVMGEVERLRIIGGHIDGLSDLDAYAKVGDMLNAQGVFNQAPATQPQAATSQPLTQPQAQAPLAAPTSVAQSQPNQELNAKRRAASTPRPTSTTVAPEPDLSNMSDDEVLEFLSRR